MRIIRYINERNQKQLAALSKSDEIYDLPFEDFLSFINGMKRENQSPLEFINKLINQKSEPKRNMKDVTVTIPIDAPEVWAAGVTYEKSKEARNYEATQGKLDSQTFYDKVYDAERPEIFFKSTAARTVGPNDPVNLRSDSNWQIPEPELGLVIDKSGEVIGYTIGNDMSCRDIEGENPLYLPQAKMWKNSCSIGPAILLEEAVTDPYELKIICRIYRNEHIVFEGEAQVSQLKRKLDQLVDYLILDNQVFDGTVLLTGTCIVPPNEFTLKDNDRVEIEIPRIGVLSNPVKLPNPILTKAN
ncbi:fumarylacetoacetate hydrolase [Peribacillus cavernae]|uniref:Fumarylacetoacetate hydrolase n=1 Tax=Peribacillus cavernae TaxID=1674310 RepID=A0A433HFJ9_9BACI|nr:fumarylacetoacetate hydrolase family protein [Peribacillus cavernae]MDQ0219476.1 2-dehydro-3-deoxy-D-arabinonate dehydratase [Peribacillus cavernae]RUQ27101.1 fumarylacetoacetate hydrolase [Peribacillus cavernae]